MTTRALIVCLGPDLIDVRIENPKTGEGHHARTLIPGSYVELNVYDTQDIHIKERKPE